MIPFLSSTFLCANGAFYIIMPGLHLGVDFWWVYESLKKAKRFLAELPGFCYLLDIMGVQETRSMSFSLMSFISL